MARTTLNIDSPVLNELKRLQREEKKPLGRIVSDLLAKALAEAKTAKVDKPAFKWTALDMRPKVDLEDKEAVFAALESNASSRSERRKSNK